MRAGARQSILATAPLIWFVLVGCVAPAESDDEDGPDVTAAPPLSVTLRLDDHETSLRGGSCVWYEDSGELLVEVGDSEGADYLILAAPLGWLGEKLPEGPGADPELHVRLAGDELPIDQSSLSGDMTPEQTEGSFQGRLEDGRALSGEWRCPEVLDD